MHPQGQCPDPAERLRIVGDPARNTYSLCPVCRAIYEGTLFQFTFVPADAPEWTLRALEHRLPLKELAAA